MKTDRRSFLKGTLAACSAAAVAAGSLDESSADSHSGKRTLPIKRIACEEAFAPPEWMEIMKNRVRDGKVDEANQAFWGLFLNPAMSFIPDGLTDLPEGRLRHMDENGIDMEILSLTAPGVQVFDAAEGTQLAISCNDFLAEVVKAHPDRFAGLAAVAPQDPDQAAKEIGRAVSKLGLRGVIINSHTHGEYLDDRKFWPIFEAAVDLDVPVYLHPTYPSQLMWPAYKDYGLGGAIWGFAAETGLHAMRMILGGVFDNFPSLKVILGHMGESIPFWFWRLDYIYNGMKHANSPRLRMPERKPSEYFLDNFVVTTSGMNWQPTLKFCHEVLGAERIMFALDYPYQTDAPVAVNFMDTAAIPDEDRHKIYQANPERIFGLPMLTGVGSS